MMIACAANDIPWLVYDEKAKFSRRKSLLNSLGCLRVCMNPLFLCNNSDLKESQKIIIARKGGKTVKKARFLQL